MTNLKEIKELLDEILNKAKREAFDAGINITSDEFKAVLFEIKKKFLEEIGITLEKLEDWEKLQKEKRNEKSKKAREVLVSQIKEIESELLKKIKVIEDRKIKYVEIEETPHIPTEEEIDSSIKQVVKEIPKPKEPKPLTREEVMGVHDWTDHKQFVSELNEIGNKIDNLKKESKETKTVIEKTAKIKPVISQPLIKEDELEGRISKKLQEKLLEPVRRMGLGIQDQVDTLAGKITAVADHNELGGIDGGTTDEYYHLTLTQHTNCLENRRYSFMLN